MKLNKLRERQDSWQQVKHAWLFSDAQKERQKKASSSSSSSRRCRRWSARSPTGQMHLYEYLHGNTVQKIVQFRDRRVVPIHVLTFAIAIEGQQQTRSHISINKVRHWDLIKSRCSCNCAMFMPTVATLFVCPAKNGTNRIEDWRLMRRDELPPLGSLARGRRIGKRAN